MAYNLPVGDLLLFSSFKVLFLYYRVSQCSQCHQSGQDTWIQRTGLPPIPPFADVVNPTLKHQDSTKQANNHITAPGVVQSNAPSRQPPPLGPITQQTCPSSRISGHPCARSMDPGQPPMEVDNLSTVVDSDEVTDGASQLEPIMHQQHGRSRDSRQHCSMHMDSGQSPSEMESGLNVAMGTVMECDGFSDDSHLGSDEEDELSPSSGEDSDDEDSLDTGGGTPLITTPRQEAEGICQEQPKEAHLGNLPEMQVPCDGYN